MSRTRKLVQRAKRTRKNRAYYERYFHIKDIRNAGLVQAEEKTELDRVQLETNRNELLLFYGFDQSQGSYFRLKLSIVSLKLDRSKGEDELRWRLATLNFELHLVESGRTYRYNQEQLVDYEEKRQNADRHEHRNVHSVGSMSIEQVLPFALARILFNGLMQVEERTAGGSESQVRQVPMRLAITTHPTCDKFDYKYNFSSKYTTHIIEKSVASAKTSVAELEERLLESVLEDRFDQPLMFQGQLETLNVSDGLEEQISFLMWGAKVKKFHPNAQLALKSRSELQAADLDDERESLFVWTECGQQVHLSRPAHRPNLIYGLVHSSFDYASYLYEARLFRSQAGRDESQVDFAELDSFNELASSYSIKLKAFKGVKPFVIEFERGATLNEPVSRIKLNGFQGFALRTSLDLGEQIRAGQQRLLSLRIDDQIMSFKLAEERLLGGKGNSLINLASLVHSRRLARAGVAGRRQARVSVPRGLVVSTLAYHLWLESSASIRQAIADLDAERRVLAAKSVHLNPMSEQHVTLSEAQRVLRNKCESVCERLRSHPLPPPVKKRLRSELAAIFGEAHLRERVEGVSGEEQKRFAVRSSAVGEDSLETSAAGQMKTILGAQSFSSICKAVVDCWTSQFELEALTYKSQNGLAFNLPMAVVVQELIECHAAGVAATCDPLTGDKSKLEITANLGLGEGVVAGKKTDTVRVSLDSLGWDELGEDHKRALKLPDDLNKIERLSGECCLSDEQIVALANLLLELRRASYPVTEREVEWGITLCAAADDSSSGSSSSSSSSSPRDLNDGFQIHLLQSRPLTHLQRLSSREIDHELDYGHPSPLDVVTRANLGEVMPGALCPLNSTYLMPITSSVATRKPFERNHSRKTFVADSFAFHAQMATMVLTYNDTLKRFDPNASAEEKETSKAIVYSMIGSTFIEPKDKEERLKRERFHAEKLNPLDQESRRGLAHVLALDSGLQSVVKARAALAVSRLQFNRGLESLEELGQRLKSCAGQHEDERAKFRAHLNAQIRRIFGRLCSEITPLTGAWQCHISATLLSMALNVICLKILSGQPVYSSDKSSGGITATEVLNDFSVLMRSDQMKAGQSTESGDISKLLNELLECFVGENSLDHFKSMDPKQLHDALTGPDSNFEGAKLFRRFMKRNGHRAFREFCISTSTWGDDSSYIVRLLAMRLKKYTRAEAERERQKRETAEAEHAAKLAEVKAKITSGKLALLKWALPRARNATVRREESKSLLIKAIHKYRLAFRHLGALLCLAGLIPSATLVSYLAIEELDEIVGKCCRDGATNQQNSLMPRLLYKARRRQQRARVYDKVTFPRPTLRFSEMIMTIREQTGIVDKSTSVADQSVGASNGGQQGEAADRVFGLVSCAGKVTGRACVISSLDEADAIEPGDILVTYSIDISWSVYFFALAGIVTEVGGIVSHGAVVAREYGIPTLCTAMGACSKFKTGQMLTLDANQGVCHLADTKEVEGPN